MAREMPEVMPKTDDGTLRPMPSTFDGGYSLSPHHMSSSGSSITGAGLLTGARLTTAGREATGAKAEHEATRPRTRTVFMVCVGEQEER